MNATPVSCTKCQTTLPGDFYNLPDLKPCPACGVPLQAVVFPALFRRFTPGQAGEAVMEETESSCFYHPEKKAVVPCEGCGRFLCALCDCVLNGQHLCTTCLESGRKKGKIKSLENHRNLHDSLALALAFYPTLFWPLTIFTAPASIFIAIRHWKTPTSIVHRTKIRFVLAIIIALMQLVGLVTIIIVIIFAPKNRP